MDLTIAERLVCPHAHPVTPLVVRADVTERGHLMEGLAGCPVCMGEWPVHGGVLQLGERAAASVEPAPDADVIAALLSLTEPGVLIVTDGLPGDAVSHLSGTYGAQIVALDDASVRDAAAIIVGAERIPVSSGVLRGAVLLRAARDTDFLASIVRALGPGARVVAADAIPVHSGLSELARDGGVWVGSRVAEPVPVELRRRTN